MISIEVRSKVDSENQIRQFAERRISFALIIYAIFAGSQSQ